MLRKNLSQKAVHPIDRHIGMQLRRFRKLHGITQADLACRIGVTSQQLQKYEKGINRLSCSRLYTISKELNIPLPHFLAAYEDPIN